MKHITQLLFAFVAIALMQPVHAQDAKAKSTLNKTSENFKKFKTLKADFSIGINDASGKAIESRRGTFYLKGDKYKIVMKEQEIITDCKYVWTIYKDQKEVHISTYDPKEQSFSPTKLFAGSYEKDYNYTYTGEKTFKGKKVDVITLKPKKTDQGTSKIILYIDKGSSMINGGDIYDKNGGSYTIAITSHTPNPPNINDNNFTFDTNKNKDLEVLDLR